MTKKMIYNKLKKLQKLAWQNDDMMDQDTLFNLQDALANVILEVARDCGATEDLIKSFPFLYSDDTNEEQD